MAEKFSPDIVITDVKMPRMDGVEMIRQLRKNGCQARFIILTAYSDFGYAQSAIRLGVSDYLLKPLRGRGDRGGGAGGDQGGPPGDGGRRPVLPDFDPGRHFKAKYVDEALEFIRSRYREDINIGMVAGYLDLSEGYLSRILKRETGLLLHGVFDHLPDLALHGVSAGLPDQGVRGPRRRWGIRIPPISAPSLKRLWGMSPSEYQSRCR